MSLTEWHYFTSRKIGMFVSVLFFFLMKMGTESFDGYRSVQKLSFFSGVSL